MQQHFISQFWIDFALGRVRIRQHHCHKVVARVIRKKGA